MSDKLPAHAAARASPAAAVWPGLLLATTGAIGFSGKAIVAKLMYRHGVDAVQVLFWRMLLALPLFMLLAWWAGRGKPALTRRDVGTVTVKSRGGETVIEIDEGPGKVNLDKIPMLKPAFKKEGGTITAASSSSINDGAAALVMMSESNAKKFGAKPIARLIGHATHAQQPEWFSTAPVGAVAKLLKKTGWGVKDVDLWEVNEAFAVVPMALMHELNIPHAVVNVHGGACALGHPIGASGARIMVTLIHALQQKGKKRGFATLCIGGGEATAVAIEMV